MSVARMSITGGEELGARMRMLSAAVATGVGRKAIGAGAQVIRKLAQARAPAYTEPHTVEKGGQKVTVQPGNLKKWIIVKRLSKSSLTAEYIVTVRNDRKSGFAARYGRLVEFGTVNFAANPFFRGAWQSGQAQALTTIIDRLSKGVAKAAAKGSQ